MTITRFTLRTITVTAFALIMLAFSTFAAGTSSADPILQGLTVSEVCTSSPESLPIDTCSAQPAGGDHETTFHPELSTCSDGWPALVARDGLVYGDQDGNGLVDGDDCDWS